MTATDSNSLMFCVLPQSPRRYIDPITLGKNPGRLSGRGWERSSCSVFARCRSDSRRGLLAGDRDTGKQRWRFDANAVDGRHVGSRSSIVMHDDMLYFSTVEDRHVVGLNCRSG